MVVMVLGANEPQRDTRVQPANEAEGGIENLESCKAAYAVDTLHAAVVNCVGAETCNPAGLVHGYNNCFGRKMEKQTSPTAIVCMLRTLRPVEPVQSIMSYKPAKLAKYLYMLLNTFLVVVKYRYPLDFAADYIVQRLECDESLPTATVLQIRHQILRAAFSTRMARNCSVVSNLVPKKPHPELILPMVLLATSGVFRGRYGFHKLLISSPWKAMAPLRKKSPFTDWYRHSYAHT
ncbi:hypothetical protein AXG93_369s1230 [Marchantia polymorpha subsp. ruderalis]|uniref:Uncharacterized protein n=1 Tax=Marchantia polymorpha subsp. ruderalis TaxID=1480154 RepID=A0A176VSL4_MARPO|nr:hypothetical protein AXG93_369s1230 [Marchantia polymorpha subsp. ruderalis]